VEHDKKGGGVKTGQLIKSRPQRGKTAAERRVGGPLDIEQERISNYSKQDLGEHKDTIERGEGRLKRETVGGEEKYPGTKRHSRRTLN